MSGYEEKTLDRKDANLETSYYLDDTSSSNIEIFEKLKAEEANHDIKLRTMSWQKTAALLFGDQVCELLGFVNVNVRSRNYGSGGYDNWMS
jgi:hypothetical protein